MWQFLLDPLIKLLIRHDMIFNVPDTFLPIIKIGLSGIQ
jgi:poly(A) polymerase Pap1